jgi:RNA polymerase sigma factor (sigma-70 family)
MVDTPEISREIHSPCRSEEGMNRTEICVWFVGEVLPLELALTQYLHRNWRNQTDIDDLLQDVYVRVCEAAKKQRPSSTKSFVFATARNLLIDRTRRERVIPIDTVESIEALNAAVDEPGSERTLMAREELRRVQSALDRLPPRCREVVVLRRIEGLSRSNIAARMGITEATVSEHLAYGIRAITDMLYSDPSPSRRNP